jgi:hypothetical protein
METKMIFLKRAFADVYGQGYNPTNYSGHEYTQRLTPNSVNVYVQSCLFNGCSSSSDGGALYCSGSDYKLLVEQTSFISCMTSSGKGGGMYFSSSASAESVLIKICGFNCSASSSGQCVYVYKNDISNINYRNHFNDSSITHSLYTNANSYSLYLRFGTILCPSVNITNNVCYGAAAYYICPAGYSGSPETCCVSYSSVVNNTTNGGSGCIYHDDLPSSQRIDTCNILNNTQTSSSNSKTIYAWSILLIKDSCILGNNKGNIVFYAGSYSTCKMTISNCTIDNDIFSNGRFTGSVTVTKTIKSTFNNELSHIAIWGCDSSFDQYGTLTGKPNIPSKSLRCLMSCNYKHPVIDALRNLQFMFLLTYLPSNPTINDYFIFNFLL